jgi:hypothetical protein
MTTQIKTFNPQYDLYRQPVLPDGTLEKTVKYYIRCQDLGEIGVFDFYPTIAELIYLHDSLCVTFSYLMDQSHDITKALMSKINDVEEELKSYGGFKGIRKYYTIVGQIYEPQYYNVSYETDEELDEFVNELETIRVSL